MGSCSHCTMCQSLLPRILMCLCPSSHDQLLKIVSGIPTAGFFASCFDGRPGKSQKESQKTRDLNTARGVPPSPFTAPWPFWPFFWLFPGLPGPHQSSSRKANSISSSHFLLRSRIMLATLCRRWVAAGRTARACLSWMLGGRVYAAATLTNTIRLYKSLHGA